MKILLVTQILLYIARMSAVLVGSPTGWFLPPMKFKTIYRCLIVKYYLSMTYCEV
uniref:Uncharacterized protein n=1 Tax=Amphimedon queenslandica TaxID=400682 RepID=A0A1X7U1K2_AMPQE